MLWLVVDMCCSIWQLTPKSDNAKPQLVGKCANLYNTICQWLDYNAICLWITTVYIATSKSVCLKLALLNDKIEQCRGCFLLLFCKAISTIPEFSKPLTSVTFTLSRILLHCTHLGCDWPSMRSAFMNEFTPYAMQAPPLKRHTHQRFREFDL